MKQFFSFNLLGMVGVAKCCVTQCLCNAHIYTHKDEFKVYRALRVLYAVGMVHILYTLLKMLLFIFFVFVITFAFYQRQIALETILIKLIKCDANTFCVHAKNIYIERRQKTFRIRLYRNEDGKTCTIQVDILYIYGKYYIQYSLLPLSQFLKIFFRNWSTFKTTHIKYFSKNAVYCLEVSYQNWLVTYIFVYIYVYGSIHDNVFYVQKLQIQFRQYSDFY